MHKTLRTSAMVARHMAVDPENMVNIYVDIARSGLAVGDSAARIYCLFPNFIPKAT
ncbi:hypothetical protein [Stieleria marina]|uniref:hypothetical protein n=1 Tax=Stieleria marina TaxID=1930275 RepID=UPI003AF3EDE8